MKFKCNCCDGIYNSLDVHFTSACDNRCAHCIDQRYSGIGVARPDVDAISKTIVENSAGVDDVLFLGGEPCLYLEDLLSCVRTIKQKTKLKVYVTTSVPKVCYDKRDVFFQLIEEVDGINLSVQHHKEEIADVIRGVSSRYDRQGFYALLPHKEKIRVNLNVVRPYLCEREEIASCLRHYDGLGFNSIKVSEIQHGKDVFISFADVFGLKMPSAFSYGCQTYLDIDRIFPGMRTPVLLKRSCFACEESLTASCADGLKVLAKAFVRPNNKYGVVYEDGSLKKGWV